MRLREGTITITELESIYGLDILFPNHFHINNLRSFLHGRCDLQKHLVAILRDHCHLDIYLSINTHEFFITLDKDIFFVWFLNMYRVHDNNLDW